jgi:hypothetical protein
MGQEHGDFAHRGHEFGKSVTFDQLDTTTYLHSDVAADGTFVEHFILQVNRFELSGSPVDVPGLGTKFGMYFLIDATGHQGAGGAAVFDSMNIALMVDRHNNDGTPSSTEQGIGFSNGTHGDFALAKGTLYSADLLVDPDGTRHPDFIQTITPTEAGEKVFGASLDPCALLEELLTTPGGPVSSPNDGGRIDVVDGTGATGLPASGVVALDPKAPLTLRAGLLDNGAPGHEGLFWAAQS